MITFVPTLDRPGVPGQDLAQPACVAQYRLNFCEM